VGLGACWVIETVGHGDEPEEDASGDQADAGDDAGAEDPQPCPSGTGGLA
jgi:hypothetical protein